MWEKYKHHESCEYIRIKYVERMFYIVEKTSRQGSSENVRNNFSTYGIKKVYHSLC